MVSFHNFGTASAYVSPLSIHDALTAAQCLDKAVAVTSEPTFGAEAHIITDRPGRYLVQLCKHFANKGRHLRHRPRTHTLPQVPPDRIQAEWTDSEGTLRLPWGQCTLRAVPGALRVRVEADDQESLERLQELASTHLDRFSRRDPLRVEWLPPTEVSGEALPPRRRRGFRAGFRAALAGGIPRRRHRGRTE
jgi:hypothetical protein